SWLECGVPVTPHSVPPHAYLRAEGIIDKGVGTDPLQHLLASASTIGQTPIFQLIGTLPAGACARVVNSTRDCERVAGLNGQNPGQVPAADERVDHPLIETNWQFPHRA